MANDTRSSWESKDDGSNSSRKKPGNSKESSTPGSLSIDTSGLRSSTREMPLQKQMRSGPPATRQFKHLDRLTETKNPVKRKSEIVEKQRMPSPLRSDRGKEFLSLGCSGSMNSEKGSGSSDDRRKRLKTEGSVKPLMLEAKETIRGEKQHPPTVGLKKMDGRTYKCLIKQKRRRDAEPGSVSKPMDDGEDGAKNGTSLVDAAAPPLSECKRDNSAGTHVQCSERPRGQIFGNNLEVKTHEVGKECDKVVNNSPDPASRSPRIKEGPRDEGGDSSVPAVNIPRLVPQSTDSITHALHTSHASASTFPSKVTSLLSDVHMVKSEEGTGLCDVQKTLHVLLKPEISKLCEILQLSEDVKVMVSRFLEYVVDNHQVNREPITILQAFQISLCWIAASLRKYEIDKKASLALAKQQLNYGCTEEEVKNVHSKLRLLKKRFKIAVHDFASDRLISKQERAPILGIGEKELLKSIKRIQKKCAKRMMKLNLKQQEEIQKFNKTWEDNTVQFEKDYRLELALTRSIHCNNRVRSEKLKRLEEEYANKLKEREHQKGILLRKLKADHLAEMNEERRKADLCLQEVKSWAEAELSLELPSYEFAGSCNHRVHEGPENVAFPSGDLVEDASLNRMQASELEPSARPRTAGSEAVGCRFHIDTPVIQLHPNIETDSVGANLESPADAPNYNGIVDPHFAEQILDGAPSSGQGPPGSVPYEVVGGAEFVKFLNPDVESNSKVDQIEDLDVSVLDFNAIKNDEAVSATNGGSLEDSSLVQPVNTLAQAVTSPQISALHGECSQLFSSTGIHDGDAQAGENNVPHQVIPLHSTDNGLTDQTDDGEALTARVEQLQLSNSVAMHDGDEAESENQDVPHQVDVVPLDTTDNGPTDETNDEEALTEHLEQLQPSKSTGMHDGDAEASENKDGPQQVEVVPLHSMDGSTNQTNDEEASSEHLEQLALSNCTGMHDGDTEASENQDVPHQVDVVPLHSTDKGPTDQTNDEEALTEHLEQLQSSKSTEMHDGDAEASKNQDLLHQIDIVPLHSPDNGPTDQTNDQEELTECMEQLQSSKSNGMHVGDAEANENQDGLQQVEVVPLHSNDNGPADQSDDEEPLTERVDQLQLSKSTGIHDGDAEASEKQESLQQVEVLPFHSTDTAPTVQTNHKEALIEGVQELQILPSSDSPIDHNQHDVRAASGVEQLPSQGLGASQPFDNEPEALDQVVIQSGENLELPPPVLATDVPLGPNLQLAVENDHQPSNQGFMSFEDVEDSSQSVEHTAWILNQAVPCIQLGMHPHLGEFGAHLPLNSTPQMAPHMLTRSRCADPLLNELERVQKEKEQTIKIYEDTKLGLKFDCDKEIDEAIAEIRRKYGDMFRNAESEFVLKRKELDSNKQKVLMNKILADAFQSKCHALLKTQQGVPSNMMQQHLPSTRPAPGPSCVTSSASAPFVHHLSPRFSTLPAMPPLIAPITPPTRNFRACGEVRAPAPHLQWSRPSSSMPSTSIPSVVPPGMLPIQHAQRDLRSTFPSFPHIPMSFPSVPHAPSHYDWARQADVTGRVMEMLFHNEDNQTSAPLNLLPPLQDLGSNLGSLDLSQFHSRANRGGGVVLNVAGSGVATDVICLSDEE